MKNKLKIFNKKAGFTVLESIVAIAVLSISISGAFSAVQQSLSQATIAKDEVRAFYLAQEAIEIIRNKRDNNQLAKINGGGNNWLANIAGDSSYPCDFNKICRVDAFSTSLVRCGDSWDSCPILKQDPTTYLYGYDTAWSDTLFKREIQIEPIGYDTDGNLIEIAVTVRIHWTKGLIGYEFKVKTHLFNWI